MKQEKIKYSDVMSLGFTEEIVKDSVYYDTYGYDYAIINKDLTKKIYLDWEKDKRTCKIVRIDSPKTCNIMSESPVVNLQHLKDIIIFFCNKKQQDFGCKKDNIKQSIIDRK